MTTVLKEQSNETESDGRVKTWIGFILRFAVTHTVVYFIAGMIFAVVMNYRELFATPEYAYMRPFDHPLVILGPSLQIFRGALLALAFLPFRKVIIESKRGWLYIFFAMLILMHIGADAADPGKIEAFIYTDYPIAVHVSTWPESIFSSLVFAWLFYTWERNPGDKRLSIPIITIFIITVGVAILGLLFTPPA
jgi:hypothetical protein